MADLPEAIVTQPEELTECCTHLAAAPQIGMDTEFVGEDTYHPHLCLIQVATAERRYLIDPLTVGPLDAFWQIITDPAHLVIVHAGREEIRICRLATGRVPENFFDLQIAAGLVGPIYPMGHGALVNQLLGVQLSKAETLTEWRSRPLTRQQIRYAFDDVRFLLPLWERLQQRLTRRGRSEWAREEFARMANHAAPVEGENERWRKLRGLGSLDRRKLAVVRELFAWREATAARTNRPTRALVRDDLLIEIAKRNPHQEGDLQVIRGLPKRDLDGILAAVQRGREVPNEECPRAADREQGPPQIALVASLLNVVLTDFCAREDLALSLVASNSDLRQVVRSFLQTGGPPEATETSLARGWRAAQVLPLLCDVVRGRRVYVANLKRESPLGLEDPAAPPAAS
jgi:ribonuclease D